MIKPTIGRVVWYYPGGKHGAADTQPNPALVAYVHDDQHVNLAAFNANGAAYMVQGALLIQEGEPQPNFPFACWMPYQINQAKKHEGSAS